MIRLALAAMFFVTAAQAETPKSEVDGTQNLAFCGSQVATLAWFYQGAVEDGSSQLKEQRDQLLGMQSIFIRQVEHNGEETIELFKKMTKASVNDLAGEMLKKREDGAEALARLNTNVRGCVELYFEKVEDDSADPAKSEDN